jgi:drug/metabolite transporter (DMT)-like permease
VLTGADAAALLSVAVWGANFPVLKQVMLAIDPLPAMLLRGGLSTLTVGVGLALAGRWRLPTWPELRGLLPVSLVGFTLNQVLYYYGLHWTSASHSGLIFTLTPLFAFGLSHLLGETRIDRRDALGLGLGVVGAALILAPAATGGADRATLLGDLLTVGAAISWAVWNILAAPVLRRHGTFLGTVWITGVGTLGLAPLGLAGLVAQDWSRVSGRDVAGLIYGSTIAGGVGSLLWYAAVRRLGAARTAIYANMESFFAVVAAALLLGERVAWPAVAGGVAVVAGVLLTRRSAPAGHGGEA